MIKNLFISRDISISSFFMMFFLTSCMTGSWVDSTLPQTGNSGEMNEKYISVGAQDVNPVVYKRHLTRGYYSAEDTVRVFYQSEAYIRDFKIPIQENKTCFELEVNSSSQEAGESNRWSGYLSELESGKEIPVVFIFSDKYIQRDRGGWYQFYGKICADGVLNPKNGFKMTLEPKYREENHLSKKIILKWIYKATK